MSKLKPCPLCGDDSEYLRFLDLCAERANEIWNENETKIFADMYKLTSERTCKPTNCDSGEIDVDVYALSCGHVVYYPSIYEDTPNYCPECGARVVCE